MDSAILSRYTPGMNPGMMGYVVLGILLVIAAVLVALWRRMATNAQSSPLESELTRLREELDRRERAAREEMSRELRASSDSLTAQIGRIGDSQTQTLSALQQRFDTLRETSTAAGERLRGIVDERLREIQASNENRLDQMRHTVEEKLQGTLEKRLGESFKIVSDQLNAVYSGLGEMRKLAQGVDDLKRVLTNVKARGTWAEVSLGNLLEQIFTPTQFARSCKVSPGSIEMVDFAVRLPGPNPNDPDSCVWLPIDSKFPKEDFDRLQDALATGDDARAKEATKSLKKVIETQAKSIRDKYICPPHTTDFAIMFLPTEGLYAEILRYPGLADEMLQRHRVLPAGPTTLAALLSSLRMGFRTLAIEQRASEVWQILGAVKTEFGKFGETLDKLNKQLETAQKTVGETQTRTRKMQSALRSVEEIPDERARQLLENGGLSQDSE